MRLAFFRPKALARRRSDAPCGLNAAMAFPVRTL